MYKVLAYIGREATQLAGLFAALIALLSSSILTLTVDQQGALNAVVVALIGFLTAWSVSGEKAAPLLAGLVQAVLSCALSFGLLLAPQVQSAIMAFVAAVIAMWLRGIVEASVPPESVRGGGAHSQ